MNMPSKKPQLNIRTDQELIDRIKNIAENEHRSLANQIEHILIKYANQYEAKQTTPPTKPENININKSKGVIAGDNNGTVKVK